MKLALVILCILPLGALASRAEAQAERLGDPAGEAVLAVPAPPAPALDAGRAELLEEWLEHGAREEEAVTLGVAIPGLIVGATAVGFSIWAWATGAGGAFGDPTFGLVLGNATFALGGILVGLCIYALADAGLLQRRLTRFRAAQAGMTSEELARFEGELRSEAEQGAALRRVQLGLGVTVAALGIPLAIASAAMRDVLDGARAGGYMLAGGFAVLGGAMIGLSFMTTPQENLWNAYQRGEGPRAALTLTPRIGLGSIGLAGTF